MGFIQLIIILLFVGIAVVNAFSRLNKSKSRKNNRKGKISKDQEVHYPSIENDFEVTSNVEINETSKSKWGVVEDISKDTIDDIKTKEIKTFSRNMTEPRSKPNIEENIDIYKNPMFIEVKKSDYQKTKKTIEKIKKLSFFKQAMIMSEILGKPKGI